MRAHDLHSRSVCSLRRPQVAAAAVPRTRLVAPFFAVAAIALCLATASADIVDPLANGPADPDLFGDSAATKSVAQAVPTPTIPPQQGAGRPNFVRGNQPPAGANAPQPLPAPAGVAEAPKDPCAA